jgi:hypothetical protein
MVQPQGDAAPFGVGYVDGFGEHLPKPSQNTSPKQSAKAKSAPAAPQMTPPGAPEIVVATDPAPSTEGGAEDAEESELVAVYWVASWRSSYDVYVWVHNSGSTAASWNLRIQLPANTTISETWAAHREGQANNAWVFTPTQGSTLAPGRTYLFAFEGTRPSGAFSLMSCAVNGVACTKFGR